MKKQRSKSSYYFRKYFFIPLKILRISLIDVIRQDGVEHAGYLAFLSFLSLFPFLIFLISIAGYIGASNAGLEIIEILLEALPKDMLGFLKPRIMEIISGPPQQFLTIAIIGIIWTASSSVEGCRTILNRAYRVHFPPPYILRRLLSIVEFFIVVFLMIIGMFIFIIIPDILNFIEKKHNVSFNYSNDVIKDIRVNKPKKNLKTQLLLEKLFSETNLKFTLLKDGQIIIFKREESEKITILDEIILNNILTKGISVKKGGKITIKPDEFKILPGLAEPDILQSIQSLPGVLNANKKLSDINIRGGTHDQNLFLWNNIKQVDLATGTVVKTLFEADATSFKMSYADGSKSLNTQDAKPTVFGVAAAALDARHNRLYFAPMHLSEIS